MRPAGAGDGSSVSVGRRQASLPKSSGSLRLPGSVGGRVLVASIGAQPQYGADAQSLCAVVVSSGVLVASALLIAESASV